MRSKPLLLSLFLVLSLSSDGLSRGQIQGAAPVAKIDLKVEKTDVREALRTVFKAFGTMYTISPDIKGSVSADFRGLVLDDAVSVLVRQVDGVVRIEDGVYMIFPRSYLSDLVILDGPIAGQKLRVGPLPTVEEPPAVTTDEKFVYVLQDGFLTKVDKETMKVVGTTNIGRRRVRVYY